MVDGRPGQGDEHRPIIGLAVGAPANLVVLGEPDVVEALRFHAAAAPCRQPRPAGRPRANAGAGRRDRPDDGKSVE